jgi:Uma2 family endonuclease
VISKNYRKLGKGCVFMPLPQKNVHTIDEIYALPDGVRAELIDGQLYSMVAPSRNHQRISQFLSKTIGNYIDRNGGSCEVYTAPFAVFFNNDNLNYVEPDISVICDPDKLDEKGCQGAPDWIIEIVSQSSQQMDYMIKLFKYRAAGVREYWIVDPMDSTVSVYNFENNELHKYTFANKVKAGIYNNFEIDFSDTI